MEFGCFEMEGANLLQDNRVLFHSNQILTELNLVSGMIERQYVLPPSSNAYSFLF